MTSLKQKRGLPEENGVLGFVVGLVVGVALVVAVSPEKKDKSWA